MIARDRGPTAAKHTHSFIRLVFMWGKNRGYCTSNPAQGTELPKERKKQTLPIEEAYRKLLAVAKMNGTHKQRTAGSCPDYLWIVMEISYLCYMRGIEVRQLNDSDVIKEGLRIKRAKGSRLNIVEWNSRLKNAVDAAIERRNKIWIKKKMPFPLKPEKRALLVNTLGSHLSESAIQSSWGDFIRAAIKNNIISAEERFSLHDLKRKGITDTDGNRHEKQEKSGHKSSSMMDVYDKSIPIVKPASE